MIPKAWLLPARAVVLAWIVFNLALLVASMPYFYQSRRHLAPSTLSASVFYGWTTEQLNSVAAGLGLNPDLAAGALFAASLVCLATFLAIGTLLFWRRSDTWMGLLVAFSLYATAPGFSGLLLIQTQIPTWASRLYALTAGLVWPTFFLVMFYLFPTGRFAPRFMRYLAAVPYLIFLVQLLVPSSAALMAISLLALLAYLFLGLLSQIYRYRLVSTRVEREQTKWIVFVFGILLGQVFLNQAVLSLFPALAIGTPARFWYELSLNGILGYLLPALIPLSIGIAILRYRLFDIDLIIRRTLVYAALTAMLAAAYLGSILALQSIVGVFAAGGSTPLVTVLSTLLIAALFVPLRRRVQAVIDRRFFRRKYNAARTVAAFGAALRDETNLEQLSAHLTAVVDEAMQPESVGLWLKAVKMPGTSR
jgi:hypothetical protein